MGIFSMFKKPRVTNLIILENPRDHYNEEQAKNSEIHNHDRLVRDLDNYMKKNMGNFKADYKKSRHSKQIMAIVEKWTYY